MSNGGKVESNRAKGNGSDASQQVGADEFGRVLSKIVVAQICKNVGFRSFNEFALEALADIAIRYLRDLGKTASFYANFAGRTECNVFDIIQGLEDLGSSIGFLGASKVSDCLTGSGTVRGIVEYVESAEEIPFSQPVPQCPVIRYRSNTPSFVQMGEAPVFKNIPAWLPAFPDSHTYIQSPISNERRTDFRADKIEPTRQQRKAESSLLNLQQRLVCNGSTVASTSAGLANGRNGLQFIESKNLFFATPLKTGDIDVSSVVLPTKLSDKATEDNRVSMLATFAPAIEAVKDRFCDSGDGAEKNLPDRRPVVHLNFKSGRKIIDASQDLSILNRDTGKRAHWLRRDDEKDDKKRRAELILRQSMETTQELTQL